MNNENTFFYILLAVVVIGFAIPFIQAFLIRRRKNTKNSVQKRQVQSNVIDPANAYHNGLPSEYYENIHPVYRIGGDD